MYDLCTTTHSNPSEGIVSPDSDEAQTAADYISGLGEALDATRGRAASTLLQLSDEWPRSIAPSTIAHIVEHVEDSDVGGQMLRLLATLADDGAPWLHAAAEQAAGVLHQRRSPFAGEAAAFLLVARDLGCDVRPDGLARALLNHLDPLVDSTPWMSNLSRSRPSVANLFMTLSQERPREAYRAVLSALRSPHEIQMGGGAAGAVLLLRSGIPRRHAVYVAKFVLAELDAQSGFTRTEPRDTGTALVIVLATCIECAPVEVVAQLMDRDAILGTRDRGWLVGWALGATAPPLDPERSWMPQVIGAITDATMPSTTRWELASGLHRAILRSPGSAIPFLELMLEALTDLTAEHVATMLRTASLGAPNSHGAIVEAYDVEFQADMLASTVAQLR